MNTLATERLFKVLLVPTKVWGQPPVQPYICCILKQYVQQMLLHIGHQHIQCDKPYCNVLQFITSVSVVRYNVCIFCTFSIPNLTSLTALVCSSLLGITIVWNIIKVKGFWCNALIHLYSGVQLEYTIHCDCSMEVEPCTVCYTIASYRPKA